MYLGNEPAMPSVVTLPSGTVTTTRVGSGFHSVTTTARAPGRTSGQLNRNCPRLESGFASTRLGPPPGDATLRTPLTMYAMTSLSPQLRPESLVVESATVTAAP